MAKVRKTNTMKQDVAAAKALLDPENKHEDLEDAVRNYMTWAILANHNSEEAHKQWKEMKDNLLVAEAKLTELADPERTVWTETNGTKWTVEELVCGIISAKERFKDLDKAFGKQRERIAALHGALLKCFDAGLVANENLRKTVLKAEALIER